MRRTCRSMKLIYLRESIFFRLFGWNDADTRSKRQRTQPRRWWRLSCRYLCCAARNPPSDDSQRHKSLVSHLSGTFLSPSLPPPSYFVFARLRLSLARRSSLSFPPRRSSPFFDFSPRALLSRPKSCYRLSPLYFPYPPFVSIVPRSWWCQPRAPERA